MNGYTLADFVTAQQITNADLLAYAESHINLPPELAKRYRDQVTTLREQLEKYIGEHPDYNLVKMLHSGSVAKGTALRQINDLDVAVYVQAANAPKGDKELLAWLLERLQEVYPNFEDGQFTLQDNCVKVIYKSSRPDVDVVPVLYEGDADSRGYLITKNGPVLTSIPLHLEFVRKRKAQQKDDFAQLVRFVKYWVANQKRQNEDFKFKSLMVELVCAHLADNGLDASDYIGALQRFFAYIVKGGLQETIFFADYYSADNVDLSSAQPIQIYDPVNPENNIAGKYTKVHRELIVEAAKTALDAVATAASSTTKGEANSMWQVVFGSTFRE